MKFLQILLISTCLWQNGNAAMASGGDYWGDHSGDGGCFRRTPKPERTQSDQILSMVRNEILPARGDEWSKEVVAASPQHDSVSVSVRLQPNDDLILARDLLPLFVRFNDFHSLVHIVSYNIMYSGVGLYVNQDIHVWTSNLRYEKESLPITITVTSTTPNSG